MNTENGEWLMFRNLGNGMKPFFQRFRSSLSRERLLVPGRITGRRAPARVAAGFALVEVLLALGVIAAATPLIYSLVRDSNQAARDSLTAQQMADISAAARSYLRSNMPSILDQVSGGGVLTFDVDDLVTAGLLPGSYQPRNSYGQTYRIGVRQMGAGPTASVMAIVSTTEGQEIPALNAARIAGLAGPNTVFTTEDYPAIAGTAPDDPQSNSSLYVDLNDFGGSFVSPGKIVSVLHFGQHDFLDDFLYRIEIPGLPLANRMLTDLDMSGNQVDNAYAISSRPTNVEGAQIRRNQAGAVVPVDGRFALLANAAIPLTTETQPGDLDIISGGHLRLTSRDSFAEPSVTGGAASGNMTLTSVNGEMLLQHDNGTDRERFVSLDGTETRLRFATTEMIMDATRIASNVGARSTFLMDETGGYMTHDSGHQVSVSALGARLTSNVGTEVSVLPNSILADAGGTRIEITPGSVVTTAALIDMVGNTRVTGTSQLEGNVGIGRAPGTDALDVQGNSRYRGDITVDGTVWASDMRFSSDRRLKSDVHTIRSALEKIVSLRGVEYVWKQTGERDIGLIAQEVAEVFPELIGQRPGDGTLTVKYANLVGPMIEAIKELSLENQTLRAEITEVNRKISEKTDMQ